MMPTNNINDYEVLSFIGTNSNCASYRVRHRLTQKEYVWKAFNLSTLVKEETQRVLADINTLCTHRFQFMPIHYSYILHSETETLYIISEDLTKRTTLREDLEKHKSDASYYSENFIWNFMYELVRWTYKFKSVFEGQSMLEIDLNLANILVDNGTGIILEGIEICYGNRTKSYVEDIAGIITRICNLNTIHTDISSKKYSGDLKNFVKALRGNKLSLRSVMFHPNLVSRITDQRCTDSEIINEYKAKLDNIRYRESVLKSKEAYIAEKERVLTKREKELSIRERAADEKMARAEIYLKNSKKRTSRVRTKVYDGDSTLSADEIGEVFSNTTAVFKRSSSERRYKKEAADPNKNHKVSAASIEAHSDITDDKKKRSVLVQRVENSVAHPNRPVSWTAHSKRHAFDLLKAMNDKENINATFKVPVCEKLKNTYLKKTTYF